MPRHSQDLKATSACDCGKSESVQTSEQISDFSKNFPREPWFPFLAADLDFTEPDAHMMVHIALLPPLRPT